jgi:hypothetical protein
MALPFACKEMIVRRELVIHFVRFAREGRAEIFLYGAATGDRQNR